MKQIIASVFLGILLSYAIGNNIFLIFKNCVFKFNKKNKEERYSRVPRLPDTRYSAK